MKKFEVAIEDRKLPFSVNVATTYDNADIIMEADFGTDKTLWRKTLFANIPDKELWKHHEALQKIYKQLEDQITSYVQTEYPEINVDWETVTYDKLLLMDNAFQMSAMIDPTEE